MAEDPQQHMLLELDKLLEDGPLHIRIKQVADIGVGAGLTEAQSYRLFRRLIRDGKVEADLITVNEPPGFIGAWLEDVRV